MEPLNLSELRLNGTQIQYLLICPRKLWLFSHHIEMEQESDLVALGQLIHEESFVRNKKEWQIDNLIQIDFIQDGVVHEIKKSNKMEEAHQAQILYYLWYLKQKGIKELKGVINYPKQHQKVDIELTEEKEQQVVRWIEEAQQVIQGSYPPQVEKPLSICKKCSYMELCWG